MKIVVPMAGGGKRFEDAGYKDPKPFIMVNGRRMIEYICDMFDRDNDEFVFIVSTDLFSKYRFEAKPVIKNLVKRYAIKEITPHNKGPVWTVVQGGFDNISNEDPVIIVHCDTPLVWDYEDFKLYVKYKDSVIVSNAGFHPHSLSSTMMAYSKTDTDYKVTAVKEKACWTNNHFLEHASAGLYYFRTGEMIKSYFLRAIDENCNWNGEFYVTLVYNLLINDGLSVFSYLVDHVLAFGTPDEVRNYEAWQAILSGSQVKNEVDLIQCFNYWRNVNNSSQR